LNRSTLPIITFSATSISPQPSPLSPALGIISANCEGSVTTVKFTFEIDSNLKPNSSTVEIETGTGSPTGAFTLKVNAPQTTGSYTFYTGEVIIQCGYANNSPFDIAYTAIQKQPSPRTIRGTVSIVG